MLGPDMGRGRVGARAGMGSGPGLGHSLDQDMVGAMAGLGLGLGPNLLIDLCGTMHFDPATPQQT